MAQYKFNIGDRVRFKSNANSDSFAGKVFTITGQTWFNGPCYYLDLPVYISYGNSWMFSETEFEGKVE